jgi:fructose-1,6-bisphosphatase/inositol monophosphatase family enzyme
MDGYNQFSRRVWDGSLNPKSTVYLDLYPGFTRDGCKTLSTQEQSKLFSMIHGSVSAVSMLGSNGLHHALVANGGKGVAGAITTALGGPWDVAPVALVLASGGAARAFSRGEDGIWVDRDPRDVYSYDFLVTGNSTATVEKLSQILTSL